MPGDKEYEDIDDILAEMIKFTDHDDMTYNMRRTYAYRIQAALRRHDTELMTKCMQACVAEMMGVKPIIKETEETSK